MSSYLHQLQLDGLDRMRQPVWPTVTAAQLVPEGGAGGAPVVEVTATAVPLKSAVAGTQFSQLDSG